MQWKTRVTALAVVLLCAVAPARGGSITGNYDVTDGYFAAPQVYLTYNSTLYHYPADQILGIRTDAPGPGIDAIVPFNVTFHAYCVEIGERLNIPPNAPSQNFHADVVALATNPSTSTTGAPTGGPVVFTNTRVAFLERLWGYAEPLVTNATQGAALQLAIWEVAFDTDHTLASPGLMYADLVSPDPIAVLAESYLAYARNTNNAISPVPLALMTDPTLQDLITPYYDPNFIPEPSSLVASAIGVGLMLTLAGRRKLRSAK